MSEFDAYRRGYEEKIDDAIAFSGQSRDFYTAVKVDLLSELLGKEARRGGCLAVLDVGCGNGAVHASLLRSGLPLKLSGVDVSREFIDEAQARNRGVSYELFDGAHLPYRDGQFDVAYAICVLHHVAPADWSGFVREMCRVVRRDGIVAIIEHNPINPLTSYVVRTCPFDRNAVLLKANTLRRVMRSAGLSAIERRYFLFTPFAARIFRRFDRMLGWLPLGAQYFQLGRVADSRAE